MYDDDFAAFASLAPIHPDRSTEELTAELERLCAEMDERFAQLRGDQSQRYAPLVWCVDESHAALDTPLDPALRARVADILAKGRTVALVPGWRS